MADPAIKKSFDINLLRRVFKFANPYKKQFFISVGLAIILAAFTPVRPYLIQQTVDKYITYKFLDMVIWITVIQVVFLLIETALRFYF